MPLIAVALIGAGAWAGYRLARHWLGSVQAGGEADAAGMQPGEASAKDLGQLEYDAASGVWRPAGKR